MEFVRVYVNIITLFALFSVVQNYAEGFAAGTLVKVPNGYERIEDLKVGDVVICWDDTHNFVERPICYVARKSIPHYVSVAIDDEFLELSANQQLYDTATASWIMVSDFDNALIKFKEESVDVYVITVGQYHNFFVSKADICAHNFIPAIVAGISFLFGSGVEIAGVSCGLASLGTYVGYKWHKNKQGSVEVGCISIDNLQADDLYNSNDAQAPGMPTEKDGYHPPKNWDGKKVKHPRNGTVGWPDDKGNVWVPTGVGPKAHGGPHWDVQHPNGKDYDNVYPGGKVR